MHKRELRNGIHSNAFLQGMWNKYGAELEFELVEECARELLRQREQRYIDAAEGRVMNGAKVVCELAAAEVHSARMQNAWKNRSPEKRAVMAAKISATLKRRYREDADFRKSHAANLEMARNSEALVLRKHSKEANAKRSETYRKRWAEMTDEQRGIRRAQISQGMIAKTTVAERTERARKAAQARTYD